ncbi:MAG: alpha/beta hydrolase [Clostridiales bacterium]|nr:alpha/beta hydrolase [Clostridiales bacterium]
MYFETYGDGDKAIVYLHGWGCDGSIFAPIARRLPGYKNYLVDFDGFGKSPPPSQDGFSVADYAERLYEFLKEQGLTRVTLVGHSFGCRVAMVLAATYPKIVERMLFVGPAGLRRFSFKRWWRVKRYKFRKFLAKLKLASLPVSQGSEDYRNCSPTMRATFVKVINEDLSRYAKRVKCPVLIVNGRADTATPLAHAKKLARLIPDCELVDIEGDHYAFFYSPSSFANTVKNFVR